MNKLTFLAIYHKKVFARYPWAQNCDKLERFLASCEATLKGESTWNHDGEAVAEAWKEMGGKGKPTLKALRDLPEA